MFKIKPFLTSLAVASLLVACGNVQSPEVKKDYVDYVNPYIGNISHLLVPTFPTVQLPNSMLRVYPERSDYTSERVNGLPIVVTNHRERSAFNLTPYQGNDLKPVRSYTYDNEKLTPYSKREIIIKFNILISYIIDVGTNSIHSVSRFNCYNVVSSRFTKCAVNQVDCFITPVP